MCDPPVEQSSLESNEDVCMTDEPTNSYDSAKAQASLSAPCQAVNNVNELNFASINTEDGIEYNELTSSNKSESQLQVNYDCSKQSSSSSERNPEHELHENYNEKVDYDHNQCTETGIENKLDRNFSQFNENFMQNSEEYNKFLKAQTIQPVHLSSQDIEKAQLDNIQNNECLYEKNSSWQFENSNTNSDMYSTVQSDLSNLDYSQMQNVMVHQVNSNDNVELHVQEGCGSDTQSSLKENDSHFTDFNDSQTVYTNLVPLQTDSECGAVQSSFESTKTNISEYNQDNLVSDKSFSENSTNFACDKQNVHGNNYKNDNNVQYIHSEKNSGDQIQENSFSDNSFTESSELSSDEQSHLQTSLKSENCNKSLFRNLDMVNNECLQPINYDRDSQMIHNDLSTQSSYSSELHITEPISGEVMLHDTAQDQHASVVGTNTVSSEEMKINTDENSYQSHLQENKCIEGSEQYPLKVSETQNSNQYKTAPHEVNITANVDNLVPQVQIPISHLHSQETQNQENETYHFKTEQSNDIQVISENPENKCGESEIQQSDQQQVSHLQYEAQGVHPANVQQMVIQSPHNLQHTQVIPQLQFRTCDIQQFHIISASNFPEQLHQPDMQRLLLTSSDFQNFHIVSAHMIPQVQAQQLNVHQGSLQPIQLVHQNVNEMRNEDATPISNDQQTTPVHTQTMSNVNQGSLQPIQIIHENVNETRMENTPVSNDPQSTLSQTQTLSMSNVHQSSLQPIQLVHQNINETRNDDNALVPNDEQSTSTQTQAIATSSDQSSLQPIQLSHENVNETWSEDNIPVSDDQQPTSMETRTISISNDSESNSSILSTDEDVDTNTCIWEVLEPLQPHIAAVPQVSNSKKTTHNGIQDVCIILDDEVIPLKEWSTTSSSSDDQVSQSAESLIDGSDSDEVEEYVTSSSDDMSNDEADSRDIKPDVTEVIHYILDKQETNFDNEFLADQLRYGKPIFGIDEAVHNSLKEGINEYLERNIKDIVKFGKRVIGLIVWQENSLKVNNVSNLIERLGFAKPHTDVILLPVFKANKENLCDHWLQHPVENSAHESHMLCYNVWYNDNPYIMSSFCIPQMMTYMATVQKRISECRKVLKSIGAVICSDPSCKNSKSLLLKYGQPSEKNISSTAPPVEVLELSSDEELEEPSNTADSDDSGGCEDFFLKNDGSWAETYVIPQYSINIGADHVLTDCTVMVNETGFVLFSSLDNRGCRLLARIHKNDIVKVFLCSNQSLPMITMDITETAGADVRQKLLLEEPKTEFEVKLKCRITIILTQLMRSCKDLLKSMFPSPILSDIILKTAEGMLGYLNSKGALEASRSGDIGKLHDQGPLKVYNEDVANKVVLTYPPPPEKGGITITIGDLMCLNKGELLNDVMIDFYLKYLWRNVMNSDDADRTYIFSNFFYLKLTTKPGKENLINSPYEVDENLSKSEIRYHRIRSWLRKVNLFEKDFIVVPIVQAMHWFVAIICYPHMLLNAMNDSDSDFGNGADCLSQNSNSQSSQSLRSLKTKIQLKIPDGWPAVQTCDEADPELEVDSENVFWSDYKEVDDSNARFADLQEEMEENNGIIKRPRILIFDSVNTVDGRSRIFSTLKDLLVEEYRAKIDKNVEFPRHLIKSVLVDVPKQRNNTDCGLYLMHFVEKFFEEPFMDYRLPLPSRSDWFNDRVISLKRGVVYDVVEKLTKEAGVDMLTLNIPPMKFKREKANPSNKGRGKRRPGLQSAGFVTDQIFSIPTSNAVLIPNQAISMFVTENSNSSIQLPSEHIEDSYGSSYSDNGNYSDIVQQDNNISEDDVDLRHKFELSTDSFECSDSQPEEDPNFVQQNACVNYVSGEELLIIASNNDSVLQVANNRRISLKRERNEMSPAQATKQPRFCGD